MPVAIAIFFIREPEKGANESSHILKAAGMDIETEQENAPKVLLGSAVTRLLRIRSLYYELVAVAILGFAGTGIPLFGSLYFQRHWHLGVAHRADVFSIIGLSSFLGLPVVFVVGDRLFRRAPEKPLVVAGICIAVFGGLYSLSLYMPHLWMVVVLQFLAQSAVAPLSICIFQTLAATAPPEMRAICFGLFGVYALVFGGFAGGILLGAISDATNVTTALTLIGPVCAVGGVLLLVGSRFVRSDITLVIEDVLERYAEGKRRKSGGEIPALQIHNMDFFYGNQQVLFDVNLEVPEGDIVALLGTNGAGKSTLLRAVAGLDHPHRGVIRIFGANCTYLEPEQIIDLGAALLVGGKMTFPGLTVRDNLRIGEHSFRRADLAGQGGARRGHRPVPRARAPARSAGGHVVGRRAADAGPGPGDDDQAPTAHDRRARLRPRPDDRGAAHGHRPAGQRRRRHGHPRRAEREPGHDPGGARLLPRAGRGPLRRIDHRPAGTRRPPPAGLPRQRGRRPRQRNDDERRRIAHVSPAEPVPPTPRAGMRPAHRVRPRRRTPRTDHPHADGLWIADGGAGGRP